MDDQPQVGRACKRYAVAAQDVAVGLAQFSWVCASARCWNSTLGDSPPSWNMAWTHPSANEFAWQIDKAVDDGTNGAAVWDFLREDRARFLNAAHTELATPGNL
ncbi:hypothetical protein ABZ461_39390 [Actinacidiphila glaucinigra]|uniref:hypothetical protein n=1 Tax=Actinacidiphila glaucinigra TaxID=235986 RepID=UPI003410888A